MSSDTRPSVTREGRAFAPERDALRPLVQVIAAGLAKKSKADVEEFEVELLEAIAEARLVVLREQTRRTAESRREAIHSDLQKRRRRPLTTEQKSAGFRRSA